MVFIKKFNNFYLKHGFYKTIKTIVYELANIVSSTLFPSFTINGRRKYLASALAKKFDNTIQGGVFKGMKLLEHSMWDDLSKSSQILGIYEQQLSDILFSSSTKNIILIDIGAADGYYGVGGVFCNHFKNSICYEIDPVAQLTIRKLSIVNNIQNKISICGKADAADIVNKISEQNTQGEKCFILADVEGSEYDLFNSALINNLFALKCEILIELHEFDDAQKQKATKLISNFENHFKVKVISEGSRNPYLYVNSDNMSITQTDKWLLCSESRPNEMRWLHAYL